MEAAAKAIESFLDALGLQRDSDPELRSTGRLVAESYVQDLISGYWQDPEQILYQQIPTISVGLVVVKDIQITTMCPHHLLPATGVVHVGYLPQEKNVGFGAIGQLVRCFANRLTLQEKLGESITTSLDTYLKVEGAGCVISLSHGCMVCRGGKYVGSQVITSSFIGRIKTDAALKEEFLTHVYENQK